MIPAEAVVALQRGNKVEAIKLTRAHTGLGLKEAKDEVEAYIAAQPQLQETFAAGQTLWRRGCLTTLAVFVVVGLIVYYVLVLR